MFSREMWKPARGEWDGRGGRGGRPVCCARGVRGVRDVRGDIESVLYDSQ